MCIGVLVIAAFTIVRIAIFEATAAFEAYMNSRLENFARIIIRQELEEYHKIDGLLITAKVPEQPSFSATTREKPFRNCSNILVRVRERIIDNEAKVLSEASLEELQHSNKSLQIPKIIHQTWSTRMIPKVAVPWIKSVLKNHEDWKYMFWTQDDIKCLVKSRFNDFYKTYLKYANDMYRADAMRYFVLFEFGGFYIDLDVESLKPFPIWGPR